MLNNSLPITALLAVAMLLTGCGDEPTSNKQDAVQPDLTTDHSSNGPYSNDARTIDAINAAEITALRKQAAADGKVLVIDCWATWCGSCVAMFPELHNAMKQHGDDVMLVSLSYDEGEKSLIQAAQFLTKHDAWHDAHLAQAGSDAKDEITAALSTAWDGGALPAVFVYGPDGKTAYEMLETRGEVADWVAEIAAAVDKALAR